ncbi:MAG: hypothetical protein IPK76_18770 [Lewinellaceae bacterium]|nr:hypothetical protein [Lewinellaceae bacterium]
MAASTKAMHQIRQIFELRQQQVGLRKIERLTGFSRNTVRDYVRRASSSGRSLPELLAMVFDFGFVGALAVGQSGKLFCITKRQAHAVCFQIFALTLSGRGSCRANCFYTNVHVRKKYPLFFGLYVAAGWLQGPFQPHPRN